MIFAWEHGFRLPHISFSKGKLCCFSRQGFFVALAVQSHTDEARRSTCLRLGSGALGLKACSSTPGADDILLGCSTKLIGSKSHIEVARNGLFMGLKLTWGKVIGFQTWNIPTSPHHCSSKESVFFPGVLTDRTSDRPKYEYCQS